MIVCSFFYFKYLYCNYYSTSQVGILLLHTWLFSRKSWFRFQLDSDDSWRSFYKILNSLAHGCQIKSVSCIVWPFFRINSCFYSNRLPQLVSYTFCFSLCSTSNFFWWTMTVVSFLNRYIIIIIDFKFKSIS